MARILGLDVGTHRIGIALSDETLLIAQPLKSLKVGSTLDGVIKQITTLCKENDVQTIVVGLPLSLSGGNKGDSVTRAKEVGSRLQAKLGVEIVFLDERFTTAQSERLLIEAGMRRTKRRQVVDKVAASLILQSYLDSKGHRE